MRFLFVLFVLGNQLFAQEFLPGVYPGSTETVGSVDPVDELVAAIEKFEKHLERKHGPLPSATVKATPVSIPPVPSVLDLKLDADSAPTPHSEIARVLGLLPKPEVGFVDFGCGADARWCIAAAERWNCRVTGIEINPSRAAAARERVANSGLGHLITIFEGDATQIDVNADVGVAYLYADVLAKLRPRLEKLRSFASYLHQPPGLPVVKNGDSWIYTRPAMAASLPSVARPMAVWNGIAYSGPICSSPGCQMCQAIRSAIATQTSQSMQAGPRPWHYVKHCENGRCWFEKVFD